MKKDIFNYFTDSVLRLFGLTQEELCKKTREKEYVDARFVLWYLCSTRMEVVYIQKFTAELGFECEHTTILHGIKRVTKKMQEDADMKLIINRIIQDSKYKQTL